MIKRIETSTEVVTVDRNNVLHVTRKHNNRNFSFAAIGRDIVAAAALVPVARIYTLFANDYPIARGSFDDMYNTAWEFSYGASSFNFIIC
jgi:hypothetical protein